MRALLALLLLAPLAGCSTLESSPASGRPHSVFAAAYPFAWVAQQVGGPDVTVTTLAKPGGEPHDLELTPRQAAEARDAWALVYLKGFQPAVDDLAAQVQRAVNIGALDGVRQLEVDGVKDPHLWLDPVLLRQVVLLVGQDFDDRDRDREYLSNAQRTAAALEQLDKDIRAQLRDCRTREIVTSHAAFGYFAQRYGLTQRGITGLSPESEPSPRRLAEVAAYARSHHVTTIFFESLVSPKVAQTVASEVGARTAVLDPIESVTGNDDYLSVMRRNAATLHTALGCR